MSSTHHVMLTGDGIPSPPTMSAHTLAERVADARSARQMTASRLQKLSGLSARTIRDIESGNPSRRYSPTTLGRLDGPLGWKPGTAWRTWMEQGAGSGSTDLAQAIDDVVRRLAQLEEEPPWARELVDAVRVLTPEDRALVFALARRLGVT